VSGPSSSEKLTHLRRPHVDRRLDVDDLDPNPFVQFDRWMQDALNAELTLPNAMTLATATKDGRPSARTVLLKGFDEHGFVFFSNYESRKASELADNPYAALVFLWLALDRQVCVTGRVERLKRSDSENYFATRPWRSRLGAWASPQSRVLVDRDELDRKVAGAEEKFGGQEIPLPPFWGGFVLTPDAIEFWQARPDRLHDRLRYRRDNSDWVIERLAP
jgi:pyridoxamine 5'-phosphate oxidase